MTNSRALRWMAAVAGMLLGTCFEAFGALPAPLPVDGVSSEEMVRNLNQQAEESLRLKLEVGKQRTEMRLKFREQLIAGMQAQAESTVAQITLPVPSVSPVQSVEPASHRWRPGWVVLTGLLGLMGWVGYRWLSGLPGANSEYSA